VFGASAMGSVGRNTVPSNNASIVLTISSSMRGKVING
jgi:hypothetical protein